MSNVLADVFRKRLVREGIAVTYAMGFLILIEAFLVPHVHDVRYFYFGETTLTDSLPVSVSSVPGKTTLEGWASVNVHSFQSKAVQVKGDDCLSAIDVNGIRIFRHPSCKYGDPDETLMLTQGDNAMHVLVNDPKGGSIGFSVEPVGATLPLVMIRLLLIFLPFFWLTIVVSRWLGPKLQGVTGVIYTGFLLRMLYVAVTPFKIRDYDLDAHVEYIIYMMRHWTVPTASGGWEFHQGPLYYALTGLMMKTAVLLGHTVTAGLQSIQYFSLFLSFLSLIAAAWCGLILFNRDTERRALLLFTILVTVFPGTLLFCSRINNDILFQLLAVCFTGCLLQWWKSGSRTWLILTSVVVGLGFLTKGNAYLFLPIALICIAFRSESSTREKIRSAGLAFGIVAFMAGWLIVLRYVQNDFPRLFLSGDGLNPALKAPVSWKSLTAFMPREIVQSPFAFGDADTVQRGYFWMYFFRTSLFGEAYFVGSGVLLICRLLTLLGMGSVLLALGGMIKRIRAQDTMSIPLLVILIISLESAIAYRVLHPSVPNQDFRFSILIVPVIAYFAVRAIDGEGKIAQLCRAWLLAFAAASASFIIALVIQYF